MRTEVFKYVLLVGLVMVSLTALGATLVVAEGLYFDDFNDGVADGWTEKVIRCYGSTWEELPSTWSVIDGEYFVSLGLIDSGISTVDNLNVTDSIIQTKLRFRETEVGFKAGIIFRFVDEKHYYTFEISNEYDSVQILKYSPEDPSYGVGLAGTTYPIDANVQYTLKIDVKGNIFTAYLNDQQILSCADDTYTNGKVGLHARRADVFFDNFRVMPTVIPATIGIKPDTLNLKSRARWITTYIELSPSHSVWDIDVGTVMLLVGDDNVPAEPKPTKIGDHDHDGIPDLKVRFDRGAVQAFMPSPGEYTLTIRGEVVGVPFEGSKTVSAITRS